jgi:hypothetical protein
LFGIFWGNFWRRGTHVNILKIGSRGAENCLGEIQGFYAVLRREYFRGNLKLTIFVILSVCPRVLTEEGGQLVFLLCIWGRFLGELSCDA